MGGFVDPFVPEPAWPQDTMFIGPSWPGSAPSSLADPAGTYLGGAGAAAPHQFLLQTGSSSTGALLQRSAKEMVSPVEQFLSAQLPHLPDDVNFEVDDSVLTTPCAISLADSAPVVCSSNDSSGSEQSGLPPRFLLGDQAAWASTFPQISSLVGEETSQSFGFGGAVSNNDLLLPSKNNDLLRHGKKYPQLGNAPSAPLQLHDDVEFDAGKMLSFTPGGLGQQLNASTNFGDLQLGQKEFSGLQHLNLFGQQQLSLFNATGATHKHEQSSEVSSGKIGPKTPPFMTGPEVPNGNGAAGNGAPKPRVRARRGQATDPHSIAERLRREKISDRMKDLQELVPNSNKTDKASMLEEIIEYVKFLQLQVKVLSMSRLGATEAVVPLLTESHTELAMQSSGGLLLPPRSGSGSGSGRQQAGRGSLSSSSEARDGAASEQEVARLMESNMTTAMQYLQSKGLCIMPIALASAISDQKGTSSAAVQPEDDGPKEMLRTVKPLGSPIQGR